MSNMGGEAREMHIKAVLKELTKKFRPKRDIIDLEIKSKKNT